MRIKELGAEGINQIWRKAKLRGAGIERAKNLSSVAKHSVGSREAPETATLKIRNLLEDYEKYGSRMDELMAKQKKR